MILEGIVTTCDTAGELNIAPMGPHVDAGFDTLLLRPFQTSSTYCNLKTGSVGVLHVVDDVELIARAAINHWETMPEVETREDGGKVLLDCCRWYAFHVDSIDESEPRTRMQCRVTDRGRRRDFWGFNRAKHAVLEAAILATRIGVLPGEQILRQLEQLASPVEKTAGQVELGAFALLDEYIKSSLSKHVPDH